MIHNPELTRGGTESETGRNTPGDRLDKLVIRAHYLALDLRVAALEGDCVDPAMTQLAADFLRYWAIEAGKGQKR